MRTTHVLFTVLFGLSSAALAGDAKAPDPKAPKADAKADPAADAKKMATTPADELASLSKFYVGTWHCEGKTTPPLNMGKTYASKGNITWTLALDGFWLAGGSEGEKVPNQPLATVFKGEMKATYDRTTKMFVALSVSNRGGWTMATSKGWEGDKLVWSGNTSGLLKTEVRTTITKKGATEYQAVAERMEAGKWVTGTDESCKKK